MTISDGVMVFAVLLAPLLAIQASEWLQARRESRHRKQWIFDTLLATRGTGLAPDHVRALNSIEFTYNGSNAEEKAIRESWKSYVSHLNNLALNQSAPAAWGEKRIELFINLLFEMSKHMKSGFEKTTLRETSYWPEGLGKAEDESNEIRRLLLALLSNKGSLPMMIVPPDPKGAQDLDALMKKYFSGDSVLKVRLLTNKDAPVDPS